MPREVSHEATRFMASLEYDGTNYAGWQRQPVFASTVQEQVERAFSAVAAEAISVTCSGRTDAGVHGLRQVIHFDSRARRSNFAWLAGVNHHLPRDIRLNWLSETSGDFHARHSAVERHYRYLIKTDGIHSALWRDRALTHYKPLDMEKMERASRCLLGERDFSAFRSAECQAASPVRFLRAVEFRRKDCWLAVDFHGNAFLHHMIRNLIGSLLMVGDGRRPVAWLAEVLEGRQRKLAGPTAPARGLYFYGPSYPKRFPTVPPAVEFFSV